MSESTQLARLGIPTDEDVEAIRRKGKQLVAHQKEVNAIFRTLEGLKWGSGNQVISGSNFSEQTRYALAEFCRVTKANPLIHIDFLGNKPYLNAEYWSDLVTNHPLYHHHEQRDLSPAVEEEYRRRAQEHRKAAEELQAAGIKDEAARHRARALDYSDKAEDIAIARANWGPRQTATSVIETTIWRFINAAPMDKIRAGEIEDLEKYLVPVSECNWAGGMGDTMAKAKKWDPIGDANPSTTARTRSLRRCGKKAFSAWMEPYDEKIRKAEEYVEAEFQVVAERVPNAVSTGSGEVESVRVEKAKALPSYGEPEAEDQPMEQEEPVPEEPPFDWRDASRALFATLRDAGIPEAKRKAWYKEHGFPDSTKSWGPEDFERAMDMMIGPVKEKVHNDCEMLGVDLADLSLQVLEKDTPAYLKDWQKLAAVLEERWGDEVEV